MDFSPLLPQVATQKVVNLLLVMANDEEIMRQLNGLTLEEKIHIFRFLYNRAEPELQDGYVDHILRLWHALIPMYHPLHSDKLKKALYEIGQWWDAFGLREGSNIEEYDELEQYLDMIGSTSQGIDYFRWIVLCPVNIDGRSIWDEHRRGAIICLGKYGYNKNMERFLVRHLDDWNTIQVEVVQILVAMKSRLLARLAPWYLEHDDLLKLELEEYF